MDIICQAIKQRKLLKFIYDGGERVVEPYAYGYNNRNSLKLRAYQVEGYSSSGKPEGWKLFSVEKIKNIEILDEEFSTIRPEYNPRGDKHIPYIICKV